MPPAAPPDDNRPGHFASPPLRIVRPSDRRSQSRSAMRALDILEHFGAVRRPLRAIELARALAIRPSTADQLLKTMVDSGHLVFDVRTKTYQPSPRLIGFSSWLVKAFGPDDRLRDLVREVQQATGMIITLTTPNDLFMQVIDLAVPAGKQAERGLRISVFGSVIGSAYLATLEAGELERLAYRARIPTGDAAEAATMLATIRSAGFADGPTQDGGMWSIAVPLPPSAVRIPLVLGLSGPRASVLAARDTLQRAMTSAIARLMG